eukprot:INCI16013.2.p1 GENE.INCI16013.2~~INCI16013.2.p1  ORF type:complete len:2717 (-),score=507.89 INCI16013.2:1526-9676(-)
MPWHDRVCHLLPRFSSKSFNVLTQVRFFCVVPAELHCRAFPSWLSVVPFRLTRHLRSVHFFDFPRVGQEALLRALLAFSLECVSFKGTAEAQSAGLLLLCQFASRHPLPPTVFGQIVTLVCDSMPRFVGQPVCPAFHRLACHLPFPYPCLLASLCLLVVWLRNHHGVHFYLAINSSTDQRQAIFVALASLYQAQGASGAVAPQFPAPALQQLMRIAQQDIGSLTQAAAAAGYRMVPLLLPLVNTLLAHIDQQQEAGTADEELLKPLSIVHTLARSHFFPASRSNAPTPAVPTDPLPAPVARDLCRRFLSAYFAFSQRERATAGSLPLEQCAAEFRCVMDLLVARFSESFDAGVTAFVGAAAGNNSDSRHQRLAFLSSLQSPMYSTLANAHADGDADTASRLTVSMALRHANATVRLHAVEALQERLRPRKNDDEVTQLQRPACQDLLHLGLHETDCKVAARFFGSRSIFAQIAVGAGSSSEIKSCLAASLESWTLRGVQNVNARGNSAVPPVGHAGALQMRSRTQRVCSAILRRLHDALRQSQSGGEEDVLSEDEACEHSRAGTVIASGTDLQNRIVAAVLPFVPLDAVSIETAATAGPALQCLANSGHPLFRDASTALEAAATGIEAAREAHKGSGKRGKGKQANTASILPTEALAGVNTALWSVARSLATSFLVLPDDLQLEEADEQELDACRELWRVLSSQLKCPVHRNIVVKLGLAAATIVAEADARSDVALQFVNRTVQIAFEELDNISVCEHADHLRNVSAGEPSPMASAGSEEEDQHPTNLIVPKSEEAGDAVGHHWKLVVSFLLAVCMAGSKEQSFDVHSLSEVQWQVLRGSLAVSSSDIFSLLLRPVVLGGVFGRCGASSTLKLLSTMAVSIPGKRAALVRTRAWLLLRQLLAEAGGDANIKKSAANDAAKVLFVGDGDAARHVACCSIAALLSTEVHVRKTAVFCLQALTEIANKMTTRQRAALPNPAVQHFLAAVSTRHAELVLDAQGSGSGSEGSGAGDDGYLLTSVCRAIVESGLSAPAGGASKYFQDCLSFLVEGANAVAESPAPPSADTPRGVRLAIARLLKALQSAAMTLAGPNQPTSGRKGISSVALECLACLRSISLQLLLRPLVQQLKQGIASRIKSESSAAVTKNLDTLYYALALQLSRDSAGAHDVVDEEALEPYFTVLRLLGQDFGDDGGIAVQATQHLAHRLLGLLGPALYSCLTPSSVQQLLTALKGLLAQGDSRLHDLAVDALRRLPFTAVDLAQSLFSWCKSAEKLRGVASSRRQAYARKDRHRLSAADHCLNQLVVELDLLQLKVCDSEDSVRSAKPSDRRTAAVATRNDVVVHALYAALAVLQDHKNDSLKTTTAAAAVASASASTFLLGGASNADFVTQQLLGTLRRYVRAVIAEAQRLEETGDGPAAKTLLTKVASQDNVQLLMACIQRSLIGGSAGASTEDGGEGDEITERNAKQQAPTSLQTTNEVLLVLSAVTEAAPGQVVASIPEMLDQVASTALLSTNRWMFHVTNQVVRTVIPAYLASVQHANQSDATTSGGHGGPVSVGRLQGVLVGAYRSIPPQNKIPFFSNLAQVLGRENLPSLVLCLFSEMLNVRLANSDVSLQANGTATCVELVADLANDAMVHKLFYHFSPHAQLVVLRQLMAAAVMILYRCTSPSDLEQSGGAEGESDDEQEDTDREDSDRVLVDVLQDLPRKYRECYTDASAEVNLENSRPGQGGPVQVSRQRLHVALLINFVSSHLSERSFLHMLLNLRRGRGSSVGRKRQVVQRDYLRLCEHLFHILQAASDEEIEQQQHLQLNGDSEDNKDGTVVDLKSMAYGVMDKLNQLLSIPGFLAAIGELLMHSDPNIRRKALDLFNQKVTQEAGVLSPEEVVLFLDFTAQLQRLLDDEFAQCKAADALERKTAAAERRAPSASASSATVANMQAALLSLHILSRAFAEAHPEPFLTLLPAVVRIVADPSFGIHWRPHVLGSALVCLASLCGGLGARMLPFLPQFLSRLVSVAEAAVTFVPSSLQRREGASKSHEQEVAVLAHSSMASLSAVVAHLPQFISSHLAPLLGILTHHSFLHGSDMSDTEVSAISTATAAAGLAAGPRHTQPVRAIRKSLCTLLAQRVNFRLLLPAVSSVYASLRESTSGRGSKSSLGSDSESGDDSAGGISALAERQQQVHDLRARTLLLVDFLGECWAENCRKDARQWKQLGGPGAAGTGGARSARAARRVFIQSYYPRVAGLLTCGFELVASCFVTAGAEPYYSCRRLVLLGDDALRPDEGNHESLDVAASLESERVLCSTVNDFVVKLTEGQLKPVFLGLCDWARPRDRSAGRRGAVGGSAHGSDSAFLALSGIPDSANMAARIEAAATLVQAVRDGSASSTADQSGDGTTGGICRQLRRSISFWGATGALCRKFKSIFVPYFEYVWRDAVDVLAASDSKPGAEDENANETESNALALLAPKKRRKKEAKKSRKKAANDDSIQAGKYLHETLQLRRMQRERVLGALCQCFVHSHAGDGGGNIVDKDHFDAIMPELVRQLDPADKESTFVVIANDPEEFRRGQGRGGRKSKRQQQPQASAHLLEGRSAIMRSSAAALGQHLAGTEPFLAYTLGAVVPCLVQLARAAADDSLWKPLHFKVCMKSRSDDWRVRFAALKVLQRCFEVIGEEFLVLLPETIPFLAELLEDESPHVEALCRALKQQIEELSGEELDPYLNA